MDGCEVTTSFWISGGGLAGLATCIALQNICGIRANILEAKSQLEGDAGTLIALWPNGLRALQAIDQSLYQDILQTGCKIRQVRSIRETGETRVPDNCESKYGQPFICIRWSTLHSLLAKRVSHSQIYLQHTTTQVYDKENHVIVETKRTHSTQDMDRDDTKEAFVGKALIVADGVRSLLRKYILNDDERQLIDPIYTGRVIARAVLNSDELKELSIPLPQNECIFFFSSDGKKVGSLSSLEQGQFYWALTLEIPTMDSSYLEKQSLQQESEFSIPLMQAIAATPAERIQIRPLLEMPPLPRYAKGNVVLIGDAAHAVIPSLGQGANIAFEDALVLSRCIKNEDNLEKAFSCYEERRLRRCQLIQEESSKAAIKSFWNIFWILTRIRSHYDSCPFSIKISFV
ncbi:6-hydroxynicotinate 3-monooxygenase [Galdieria sulphuraria]|nr:6-hydroxynicotinate 3-monooxygenase [Galdieria sulphuraria]